MQAEVLYREYVVDHGLERRGLFEALSARDPSIDTVLYPGSLLYLTPSFVFRHVVYVDQSDLAARFFADSAGYLSVGGLLLTDNHRGDGNDALRGQYLQLVAVGTTQRRRVSFEGVDARVRSRVTSEGLDHVFPAVDYFLFERRRFPWAPAVASSCQATQMDPRVSASGPASVHHEGRARDQ